MPESCKRTIIVKGVVNFVTQRGAVHGEVFLAGKDVQVGVVPVPDSYVLR